MAYWLTYSAYSNLVQLVLVHVQCSVQCAGVQGSRIIMVKRNGKESRVLTHSVLMICTASAASTLLTLLLLDTLRTLCPSCLATAFPDLLPVGGQFSNGLMKHTPGKQL